MKRVVPLTVAVFAGLLALAAPALAHVTVTAPGATSGGSDQEITFQVPVEKTIPTVALTVQLPIATPIVSVLVEPLPGWTHTQSSTTLAKPIVTDDGSFNSVVSTITWTAQPSHGLRPGEFGAFTIIAGRLPNAASITFKALQKYADGSVVSWIQVAAPGSTVQPANPAPVLDLAAATAASTAPATSSAPSSSSNTGPVVLSIIALVLAVAALGLAFVGRAKHAAAAGVVEPHSRPRPGAGEPG